jgi:hypothetical protein
MIYKSWKKYQIEILEMKSSVTQIKNSLESLANRREQGEKRIPSLEYILI